MHATDITTAVRDGAPQAHGDVGNWGEPLGLASLFVEGCLIALSAVVLALPAMRRRPARHASWDASTRASAEAA